MQDLCLQPAYILRQMLLSKQLSAVELLAVFEKRIAQFNPAINALVTLDFERAYQAAKTADDYLAQTGDALGALHGLPLAVKDIFHVAGMRTTFANRHFRNHISSHDDILVQRERAAGAVIVGKSNTPDCAAGGVTTNEIFGLTRNPWNPDKTTSGSGGGGAAAIAAGLVSIADGSDVGGSARSPAAWTNCVGFRPSSGRIPDQPGSIADGSISTAGVFTRCVADVLLFMRGVDGPNPHSAVDYPAYQSHPSGQPVFSMDKLHRLPAGKVGFISSFAGIEWPDDVLQRMDEVRFVLKSAGIKVEDVDPGFGDAFRKLYSDVNAIAVCGGLPDKVFDACLRGEPTKPSIQAFIEHYLSLSPLEIRLVWRDVAVLKVSMQLLMAEYPLLIFPTHSGYAFDVDDVTGESDCDWATLYLAPMLGLPAISVPGGSTGDKMPFGVMMTGRAGEDMSVLQLAALFERETEYYKHCPGIESLED